MDQSSIIERKLKHCQKMVFILPVATRRAKHMESMPDVEGMYTLPNILEENCSRTVYPCENVNLELLPKPMRLPSKFW